MLTSNMTSHQKVFIMELQRAANISDKIRLARLGST